MSADIVSPVAKAARVQSLDVLRGISLLGILMMNITAFGQIIQAYGNPMVDGGATGKDLLAFEIINVGFEGTMRGIFSLLFGAGIVLLTERMEKAGDGAMAAEVHFRRMLWMMLFGIVHWALLLWYGEILFNYAICGLVLFSFRKLPARKLAIIGAVLLVGAALLGNLKLSQTIENHDAAVAAQQVKASGVALNKDQEAAIETWKKAESNHWPTDEEKAEQTGWHSGSWWSAVKGQFNLSYEFQWTSMPEWLAFDMVPFMLIGMALLKWGVLGGGLPVRSYAGMMIVGYGIGIPLGLYELSIYLDGQFATLAYARAGETYQISRLAMVIGHLGLALLVIRMGLFKGLQRALAAVGQMALSNYISQTLICTALFYGFGFGLFSHFDRHELYYIVFAIWAVQLIWSPLWLARFRFGPMEWLWRSLTYWKRQPMKI
ncbi:DUF418 domain-containing protein [Novosphingobium sp.]|uniref:DUF418 domain-containing protein n=1 Tax=Novosphingobium sp. TaxID=1874826 RepID=UPI00286D714D|nr:DUF418 domain-containing protein [Novosphingobium sp.]